MSLTSVLSQPHIKKRFSKEFLKPEFNLRSEILAPSLYKNPRLIGTAFDYLARFHARRVNRRTSYEKWVAEEAVQLLKNRAKTEKLYGIRRCELLAQKGEQILAEARIRHRAYLKTGKLDSSLCRVVLQLAQLDGIYRTRGMYIDDGLKVISKKAIRDLKRIGVLLKRSPHFKAKKTCILNPTFGIVSLRIGGADADLIIDDMLIEIKTTKYLKFTRQYFNQLMGYYTLTQLSTNKALKRRVKKLGIYFARYQLLYSFEVAPILNQGQNFSKFKIWFRKKAFIF